MKKEIIIEYEGREIKGILQSTPKSFIIEVDPETFFELFWFKVSLE